MWVATMIGSPRRPAWTNVSAVFAATRIGGCGHWSGDGRDRSRRIGPRGPQAADGRVELIVPGLGGDVEAGEVRRVDAPAEAALHPTTGEHVERGELAGEP